MKTIVLVVPWLLFSFQGCLAADFLKAGQHITGNSSTVLVSAGNRFALGFFTPPGSSAGSYLGIWYHQSQDAGTQTVVWVANRDHPVVDSYGVFQIADDGNIVVTNTSGGMYWSSQIEGSSSSTNRTVKLLDSGNLVLIDGQNGTSYIWQSFQHPTDTFLPGMKMDTSLELTSWRGDNDPRSGNFTFSMSRTGGSPYIISRDNKLYWESEKNEELNMVSEFDFVAYMLSNFSLMSTTRTTKGSSRYKVTGNKTVSPSDYNNTRLQMNSTGHLQFLIRDSFQGDWSVHWMAPENLCDTYNFCGNFFSCNAQTSVPTCKCLPGFSKSNRECVRKSVAAASCGEGIRFLRLVKVKMGRPDLQYSTANESDCKNKCLKMCPQCQAYSYAEPMDTTRRGPSFSTCWIWNQNISTIQEGYIDSHNGRSLHVRVDISDIAPTPKTCEPCGTNIVPYPLSTGPDCGDPTYFKFSCNHSTGQLSFTTTTSGDATVIRVDVDSRMFIIQVNFINAYCRGGNCSETLQVPSPFNVKNDYLSQDTVEVTWPPPSEPICTDYADCKGWNRSSCKETKDGKRCLCDTNYRWDGVSLNCTTNEAISVPTLGKEPKASEGNSESKTSLILGITLAGVVVLACTVILAYVCRRKITHKKDKESIQRNQARFHDSVRHVKDLIEVEGLEEKDNEGIEVPYFDFESILVATDNFSDANKLGKGGYGPVYKGKLQSDEVVAVKRLSSVSSQGLQEFKNEVVLIAKLQHRNLVRLRGYCIKGNEKILLYEYMHNKSLDLFIFDPMKSQLLNWQMRFDIILGVARGMLYLHHDSRLRVIHRDLKISNILLNEEMQPKISDFGLAKIVTGKETEANTTRVVGTYGYMSPEYALDGLFSTKSDVFSFGVVVLEIISGKKNVGFYNSQQFSSLLSFAWTLWTENRLLDLMDMSLGESCNTSQLVRCAHIGLLCVQDEPGDRPTMSNVVTLLDSETSILPTPKQPTFFANRGQCITTSSSKAEISMQFESSSQEVEYSTTGL